MRLPIIFLLLVCLWANTGLWAQTPKATGTSYQISFPNAVHHEAEVKATFRRTGKTPLQIRMARSSPGRYALHEFAKNIYNIRITDQQGKPVEFSHLNPHQWTVSGAGTVVFQYTLFGDRADGTYNQIDRTHAHLNMPATLVYALGMEEEQASVEFIIPEGSGWKIATQLKPETKPGSFSAPNLQYLMDSPAELAPFMQREWAVSGKSGKPQTIALALHHTGTEAEADRYTESLKKIVREAEAVFGALPDFDYQRYTFIACYMPHASGDGMEHRNSTIITSSASIKQQEKDLLGTAAHEFFHAWNVERIRPKSLEPFRFNEANMSSELWLAEGFTSYYGELLLKRAGIYTEAEFLASLQADINSYLLSPGSQLYSPMHMSEMAPFVDAARSVDPVNWANTYLSYYTYGAVLAAYLDLTLRSRYTGISLDNFMRALWKKHPGIQAPYTSADVQTILAEVTGDKKFAEAFFTNHITGNAPLDFAPVLNKAGLLLKQNTAKASIGRAAFLDEKGGLRIAAPTLRKSPLYQAGLDQGDLLIKIEGKKASRKVLAKVLSKKKPGEQLYITFQQRGKTLEAAINLVPEPNFAIVPIKPEEAGHAEKISFRRMWLDSKSK